MGVNPSLTPVLLRGSYLTHQGRSVRLRALERKLALALGQHGPTPRPYHELVMDVWGQVLDTSSRANLQQLVWSFRKQLERLELDPELGRGPRFNRHPLLRVARNGSHLEWASALAGRIRDDPIRDWRVVPSGHPPLR